MAVLAMSPHELLGHSYDYTSLILWLCDFYQSQVDAVKSSLFLSCKPGIIIIIIVVVLDIIIILLFVKKNVIIINI